MRDVWEISGVRDGNGKPIILREDSAWAYVEIGHAQGAISTATCSLPISGGASDRQSSGRSVMIRRIFSTLCTSTLSDWMAMAIFAFAFVGCVEAPWIARAMPSAPAVVASRSSHAPHVSPRRASIRIAGERK